MALTILSPNPNQAPLSGVYSPSYLRFATLTGDTSYPAGGYAVTPTSFALTQTIVGINTVALTAGNFAVIYDSVNAKARFYNVTAGTAALNEVTSNTNLSGVTVQVFVVGW